MDFITDLPPSYAFDTLLVVVNCLSKQAHFIPTIKLLDASSLAQLSFLLSSNFTAYLPVLYLIVTWFSPPNSCPNLLHILVLNSNCLPLIILNQMAKQNVSTNVLNSTCRTSVCTNKTIGSIGWDEWNFNITTSFMIPLVLLLSLLTMVFILFFLFPQLHSR